jgi:hypothetical protein
VAKVVFGWLGIAICTVVAGFWCFWGGIEGFHEGWFHGSLLSNAFYYSLYLLPGLVLAGFTVVAIHRPKVGAVLFSLLGVLIFMWAVPGRNVRVTAQIWPILACFTAMPVLLGLLFLRGEPRPRRVAAWVAGGIPVLVVIISGSFMIGRVLQRVDDGNRGPRVVQGNGVLLEWAGAGPGWERKGGVSWHEAMRRCAYLSRDGKTLCKTPQNTWRLPTTDELVRSLALHGTNCGGTWDPRTGSAHYRMQPDKESPLWDTRSQVTYWWTSTEKDANHAYWVVYHGGVFVKPKNQAPGNVGFRAVRDIRANDTANRTRGEMIIHTHDLPCILLVLLTVFAAPRTDTGACQETSPTTCAGGSHHPAGRVLPRRRVLLLSGLPGIAKCHSAGRLAHPCASASCDSNHDMSRCNCRPDSP